MDNLIAYSPSLAQGTLVTISVGISSLLISIGLGLLGAWGKLSPNRLANWTAAVYTTAVRGVPELVLMLLLFFGGQILINDLADAMGWDYIDIDPFTAGTLTIGFIYGAYMTEIFRGGIEAVPFGEVEAAKAAGMSPFTRVRRIILPGALRRALPAYSNEVIFMLHGSAIASVITIIDILGAGRELNGKHYLAFEGFITAGVLYFLLTFAIVGLFKRWEKAWFAHLKPREG